MSYTIAQAIDWAKSALAGGESPAVDAKVLLAHVLDKSQTYLFTWSDKTLTDEQFSAFRQLVDARVTGHPVAHLTGYRDFWTLKLAVNPSTLIPRPDTELLVEHALRLLDDSTTKVCDLGTGTGAIALSIASEMPHVHVTGVDKIEDAVALAKQNAALNQIDNVTFLTSHWFDALKKQRFDMVVTNPPYVESSSHYLVEGDVRFEPLSALTSGEDGLDDIRTIITKAKSYLTPQGWLLIEHGYNQRQAIQSLLRHASYDEIQTFQDLAGLDRITIAKRVACD